MTKHYYKILGVSEDASTEVIEEAYVLLKDKFNSVKNPNSVFLREMSEQLTEAYDTLGNEERRIDYNFDFLGIAKPKPKVIPFITFFKCEKNSFTEGEELLFCWEVIDADIIRIEPFGLLVDASGEQRIKIQKGQELIKLKAINTSSEVVIETDIVLVYASQAREVGVPPAYERSLDRRRQEENTRASNTVYYPTTSGNRIGRSKLFLGLIGYLILASITLAIIPKSASLISGLIVLFIGIRCIILIRKRLHDIGQSGWLMLLLLIPFFQVIPGLILLIFPGNKGANKYGIR